MRGGRAMAFQRSIKAFRDEEVQEMEDMENKVIH
jgi:hypothetical protein